MKKKDILLMDSEGVFNYFYPTLCLLTNEKQQLKGKVEELEKEIQILTEANDNLQDMLEDTINRETYLKNRETNLKLDKIIEMLETKND